MSIFLEQVIDRNRAVDQFSYARSLAYARSHPGEPRQQLDMVKQGIAESLGSLGIIFGDVTDDFGEVVQRSLRVEEAEIHLGNSSRTSSAGTVRPALASRNPSSIAASVAWFSASGAKAGFSNSDSLLFAINPMLVPACRKHNRTLRYARHASPIAPFGRQRFPGTTRDRLLGFLGFVFPSNDSTLRTNAKTD